MGCDHLVKSFPLFSGLYFPLTVYLLPAWMQQHSGNGIKPPGGGAFFCVPLIALMSFLISIINDFRRIVSDCSQPKPLKKKKKKRRILN